MSLNNINEIWTETLVRNNRSTTDSFITDSMLKDWLIQSHKWAASYHKWPFTEGRISTTYTTGLGEGTDEWNFEGYKADSFRLISIGGKRLTKLNYADYQIMKEESPDADDRVYSDFGRIVFINPKADVSGTIWAYGQYEPYIDITDDSATSTTGITVFTNYDAEGNEAIVEKMSSYLKRREHLVQEAELHDQRAANKLEEIWKRIMAEQAMYQTHPDREGIFKRFNVLDGSPDTIKRNQF